MNYKLIIRYLGMLLMFVAGPMMTSIIVGIIYNEWESVKAYSIVSLSIFFIGLLAFRLGKTEDETLYRREAIAIVSLTWFIVGIFCTPVLMLDGVFDAPSDAFFETISGFTTTGATVLNGIEDISHASKWWRTLMHWLGGLGIIALFVAIFPQLGVGGKHLFQSEMAGPITSGLRPKIRETAVILLRIYTFLTLLCASALVLTGLSVFDAITHSFSALATGGFANYDASISALQNPAAEYVLIIFMIIGAINFSLYYFTLKGKWNIIPRNYEFRFFISVLMVSGLFVSVYIFQNHRFLIEESFRTGFFQVVSIMTSTGFITDDYEQWHFFPQYLLALLMIMGGMAGSTAGGAKNIRVIIILKMIFREIYSEFRPQAVKTIRVGQIPISNEIGRAVAVYFAILFLVFAFSSVFMTIEGISIEASVGATIGCMFNIGPGFGEVGPIENYSHIPGLTKISLAVLMILGRLEFITVMALIIPRFWQR